MNANSELTAHDFEMPSLPPQRGEVWLSVELSAIHDRPIANVMKSLIEAGYQPQLRYRQLPDRLAVFALLKHEQHESLPEGYLEDELETLAELVPPEAISSPRNYGKRPVTMV
ncbi:acyl carrier protein [Leptolyngbya sp. GB1-A1]|uniref:acyl carrier protein n=1 Tax=unclassified Leptolyngbya TaxID=2650499 RepID=UPI003299E2F4